MILALDFGTQSVRALLLDGTGRTVARAQLPIDPYVSPRAGWAEQDPEYLWSALGACCRELWTQPGADATRLLGVSLTTQRNTVLCLDDAGAPVRPAIVWLDQRTVDRVPPLALHWRIAMTAVGMGGTIAHLRRQAESLWLQAHEPETWRKTATFCFLSGFLTWRLTGRRADSVGCQVGYVPFDYRRLRWASALDWRWSALGIRRDQLVDLVPVGEQIGTIQAPASRHTGIPEGTPLIAAASDTACEALGVGAVAPWQAALSYGTTAAVNVVHRRWVAPYPFLPAYPSAVPGAWSAEVQVARGFWMVRWFREEFAHPERERARASGVEAEAFFDELLDSVPAGADGLVLQPTWSPGVRHPGPEARGAIVGWTDAHGRAHLYRAIIEGIAYALREGLARLERRARTPVRELRVCGGGSRSDATMQLTADLFGRPAVRATTVDTAALGAAMIASAALGLHADVPAACRAMGQPGRTFVPDPARQQRYEALYGQVYRGLYARLRPVYERMRRLDRGAES